MGSKSKNKKFSSTSIKNRVNLFEEASGKTSPQKDTKPSGFPKKKWGSLQQESIISESGSSEVLAEEPKIDSPNEAAGSGDDLELDLTTEDTEDLFGHKATPPGTNASLGQSYSPTLANTPQSLGFDSIEKVPPKSAFRVELDKESTDTFGSNGLMGNVDSGEDISKLESSQNRAISATDEIYLEPSLPEELDAAIIPKEPRNLTLPNPPSATSTEDELDSRTEVALNHVVENVLDLSIDFDPLAHNLIDSEYSEADSIEGHLTPLPRNQHSPQTPDSFQGTDIDLEDATPTLESMTAESDLVGPSDSSVSDSLYDVALASSIREASDSDTPQGEPTAAMDSPTLAHTSPREAGASPTQEAPAVPAYLAERDSTATAGSPEDDAALDPASPEAGVHASDSTPLASASNPPEAEAVESIDQEPASLPQDQLGLGTLDAPPDEDESPSFDRALSTSRESSLDPSAAPRDSFEESLAERNIESTNHSPSQDPIIPSKPMDASIDSALPSQTEESLALEHDESCLGRSEATPRDPTEPNRGSSTDGLPEHTADLALGDGAAKECTEAAGEDLNASPEREVDSAMPLASDETPSQDSSLPEAQSQEKAEPDFLALGDVTPHLTQEGPALEQSSVESVGQENFDPARESPLDEAPSSRSLAVSMGHENSETVPENLSSGVLEPMAKHALETHADEGPSCGQPEPDMEASAPEGEPVLEAFVETQESDGSVLDSPLVEPPGQEKDVSGTEASLGQKPSRENTEPSLDSPPVASPSQEKDETILEASRDENIPENTVLSLNLTESSDHEFPGSTIEYSLDEKPSRENTVLSLHLAEPSDQELPGSAAGHQFDEKPSRELGSVLDSLPDESPDQAKEELSGESTVDEKPSRENTEPFLDLVESPNRESIESAFSLGDKPLRENTGRSLEGSSARSTGQEESEPITEALNAESSSQDIAASEELSEQAKDEAALDDFTDGISLHEHAEPAEEPSLVAPKEPEAADEILSPEGSELGSANTDPMSSNQERHEFQSGLDGAIASSPEVALNDSPEALSKEIQRPSSHDPDSKENGSPKLSDVPGEGVSCADTPWHAHEIAPESAKPFPEESDPLAPADSSPNHSISTLEPQGSALVEEGHFSDDAEPVPVSAQSLEREETDPAHAAPDATSPAKSEFKDESVAQWDPTPEDLPPGTATDFPILQEDRSSDMFVPTQEELRGDAALLQNRPEVSEAFPQELIVSEKLASPDKMADDGSSVVPTGEELSESNLQGSHFPIQRGLGLDMIEEDGESPMSTRDRESAFGLEACALEKIVEDDSFLPTHEELSAKTPIRTSSPEVPHGLGLMADPIQESVPDEEDVDPDFVLSGERSFNAGEEVPTKKSENFFDETFETLNSLPENQTMLESSCSESYPGLAQNVSVDNTSVQPSVPELLEDEESIVPSHQLSGNASEMEEDFTDDGLSMGRVTKVDLNLLSEEIGTPEKASTPNVSYDNDLPPSDSHRESLPAEDNSIFNNPPASSPSDEKVSFVKESTRHLESGPADSKEDDTCHEDILEAEQIVSESKDVEEEPDAADESTATKAAPLEYATPTSPVIEGSTEQAEPGVTSLTRSSSESTKESISDDGFDTQPSRLVLPVPAKKFERPSLSPLSKEITLDKEPSIGPIESPHRELSQAQLELNPFQTGEPLPLGRGDDSEVDQDQVESSPSQTDATLVLGRDDGPETDQGYSPFNAPNSREFRVAELDYGGVSDEEAPTGLADDFIPSREAVFKASADSASIDTIRSVPLDSPMVVQESSRHTSHSMDAQSSEFREPSHPNFSISDARDVVGMDAMNSQGMQLDKDQPPQLDTSREIAVAAPVSAEDEEKYGLKPIRWFAHKEKVWKELWVLTQNENGPCPLIALCNVLILRGGLIIAPKDEPEILFTELIQLLGSALLSRSYQFGDDPTMLERILSFLPTLRTGLDVNIGFQSVRSFGASPEGVPDEMTLFGAFGVELVHGWVPDPEEDEEVYRVLVLGPCGSTYNGAMDFLVQVDSKSEALDAMPPESVEHDALVVSSFLEKTATQMTYHGLTCLSTTLPNDYLCVLFRNNHFLTLYKRTDGELYLLVTDSGYGQSDFIVWESLMDLDQIDSQFFTSEFTLSSAAASQSEPHPYHRASSSQSTELSDHNLAMSLQRQEDRFDAVHRPSPVIARDSYGSRHSLSYKSQSLSSPSYHGSTLAAHRRAISHQPGHDPNAPQDVNSNSVPNNATAHGSPSKQQPTSPKKDKQCVIS